VTPHGWDIRLHKAKMLKTPFIIDLAS
jgi:hypothetical protein